jgi:3-hydroxymyristoyl/3-hydroxydecanoyl-(acyl carrier protein) dehydratase
VRALAELPHDYPFRFVETIVEPRSEGAWRGTVRAAVSSNGRASAEGAWGSPLLLVEAIAQSALLLEGGDPEIGRTGFLVGIDGFEASRAPRAGEVLEIRVRLAARFGAIVKFEGEVWSGEEEVARGGVLVRQGGGPAE